VDVRWEVELQAPGEELASSAPDLAEVHAVQPGQISVSKSRANADVRDVEDLDQLFALARCVGRGPSP